MLEIIEVVSELSATFVAEPELYIVVVVVSFHIRVDGIVDHLIFPSQ